MSTKAYKSENVTVGWLSDALPEECESVIGKTVAKIEAGEYSFGLSFTDGSTLYLGGSSYDDSALSVTYAAPLSTQREESK